MTRNVLSDYLSDYLSGIARIHATGAGTQEISHYGALARSTRRPAGLATRFADVLQRVLLHQAALARPEDVAFFLASHARDALARVEERAELPAFRTLRGALEQALGLAFDQAKGEHLFRATLVQTLFYRLFSAWVKTAREAAGSTGTPVGPREGTPHRAPPARSDRTGVLRPRECHRVATRRRSDTRGAALGSTGSTPGRKAAVRSPGLPP